jgi:spore coat protein H
MQQNQVRPPRKKSGGAIVFWVLLGLVSAIRYFIPNEPAPTFQQFHPPPEQNWRPRRAPIHVHPPVTDLPPDLWRLHIEIDPRGVEALRSYHWNGWDGREGNRPQVLATVREGDRVYTNVTIHLKGSAGSFRPFDDKPALTLNFSKNAPKQRFHEYKKISLNNSVQDSTYVTEALCRELFTKAGVPSPNIHHATVVLNGRDLQLFVVAEGWEKQFLKRHFPDEDGNLYDAGFLQDVNGQFDTNSGDDRDNHQRLRQLAAIASEPPSPERWTRLAQVLDTDRFATFLALEILTCHWDGYALNRNNYRIFHDRSIDRLVFMPHGLDQMFGSGRSSPTASIQPSMRGIVARAFMGSPEGRRLYFERLKELRATVFTEEALVSRAREIAASIRPTLAAYGDYLARHLDAEVDDLCHRIALRVRSVDEQLATPYEPIEFTNGAARPGGWYPRVTARQGPEPVFEREGEPGDSVLCIRLRRGGGAGSWRTRALLEAGVYHFSGRFRTRNVDPGGGVCLRISGSRAPWFTHEEGPDDWMDIGFPFEITEPVDEVELICELGGAQGEACFQENSLRLVKIRP